MRNKTVAIYDRVSTDKQKVDRQLRELGDFAKRSGWKVYKKDIDQEYTVANTKRAVFIEMMNEAKKGNLADIPIWANRLSFKTTQ
jgi:DNA invertase Pin-like site-specific DNA recombinase